MNHGVHKLFLLWMFMLRVSWPSSSLEQPAAVIAGLGRDYNYCSPPPTASTPPPLSHSLFVPA
jgi:hypothetical protein